MRRYFPDIYGRCKYEYVAEFLFAYIGEAFIKQVSMNLPYPIAENPNQ